MPAPSSPPAAPRKLTPAMRQYAGFKKQHPDCVLFFRMGDFYEMFEDDAVLAHRVLGITLTQRTEGVPMAGVPHHAVETYLRRMIAAGHRVAVCDQVQDPKEAKGVVDRAVTRVLTPGTLVDEALLEEGAANLVAAVHPAGGAGPSTVAAIELSTGSFTVLDVPAGALLDELVRLGPSEILFAETDDGAPPAPVASLAAATGCAPTPRADWTFRAADAAEALRGHYGVHHLAGFGFADDDDAVAPAGALLRYLLETQAGADGGPRLAHLAPPRRESVGTTVAIDAASLRSLEIERTVRRHQHEGSLLWTMQRCRTPMGKRLLRRWLCFPSRDRAVIEARQDVVAALVTDRDLAAAVGTELDPVQDVARITGRLGVGRATPRDLVALARAIERLGALASRLADHPALAALHGAVAPLAERLAPLAASVRARCVDEPPGHLRDGGLFRDGVDAELDEARGLQRDGGAWLVAYQQRLVEATGIASLKTGFNRVFGYYIEVTHVHAEKVPDTFSRKQTLKNAERYVTPELKDFERKVTTAEARALEREKHLFDVLCDEVRGATADLAAAAERLAEIDVLACFAEIAVQRRCVRPTLVDEPVVDIREGRHPVLDRTLRDGFVPNDCALGAAIEGDDDARAALAVITGPNMAGKSTFIRQVALLALLAHTGAFVPAASATIGMVDRIFTRIGAADELHAGQSTFMVEMTETASILHHATAHSLVVLDEIGRGTSTLDGLSLAWAIAEAIAERGCRTLFATHYHELTALADRLPAVRNLHVAVREWGDDIIFLHRILAGRTDRSYGIHVAQIAGVPKPVIARARALLETLAVQTDAGPGGGPPAVPGDQLRLFTEYLPHPVIEALRNVDLDRMTPMEAFDALRRLAERANE